jgi:hypothetical protein
MKSYFYLFLSIFMLPLVLAVVVNVGQETGTSTDTLNLNVNESEIWVTNEGKLDNAADLKTSWLNNDANFFDNINDFTGILTPGKYCKYDGSNIVCNYDAIGGSNGTSFTNGSSILVKYIGSDDWSNITITESQISDLQSYLTAVSTTGWDKSVADDYNSTNFTANLGTATSGWDTSSADDYTSSNFTANLGTATSGWDTNAADDVTIGSANLTKVYCGNITGSISNLCTLVATSTNSSYVVINSENQVRIVYQNITNIPTCTGTNKLTFDGTTLKCSADLQGGEGAYLSKTGDTGIGNYIINGDFTQGYGFLAAPTGKTGTLNYGAAGYLALNTTHSLRIYAYKTVDAIRYYSSVGQTPYYNDNNDQVSRYVINWSWDPVDGAEGYKVLKYDSRQGYNYNVGKDLGNVTSFIDGADIVLSGVSVLPVAWYHFNSDTLLNDSSIYGNNGTFPISEQYVPGKLGQAINFSGSGGGVDIGSSPTLNIRDSISIETWINAGADGDYKGIVVKEYSASYYFGTGTGGEAAISFYYGAGEFKTLNVLYFNNTWQHVVLSYNRTNQSVYLYIDGVEKSKLYGYDPLVPGLDAPTYLGRQADGGFQITGMLDEMVIYNNSLTASDVAFRYNSGNGTELMNSGYTVSYFSDDDTHTPTAGAYNIISKGNTFTSAINMVMEQNVDIVGYLTTGYPIKEANVSLVDRYYLKSNPKNYINSTTTHNFIKTNNITSKANITGWDDSNKTTLALKKGLTGNITKKFYYKKLNTTLTVANITATACNAAQKITYNGILLSCATDIDYAKNLSYYPVTNPKSYYNSSTLPVNNSYVSVESTSGWDKSSADDYTSSNFTANLGTSTSGWDTSSADDYTNTNFTAQWNILTTGNTTKNFFYKKINDTWNNATNQIIRIDQKAVPGTCPPGYAIQNTTTSGVYCVLLDMPNTIYYPVKIATTGGTNTTANKTAVWYDDARSYNITEGSGENSLAVLMNYTGVATFNTWEIKEYYVGSSSHNIQFSIWDYDSSSWEQYWNIVGQNGFNVITLKIADPTSHISGGKVQIRLFHVENGETSHRLYIDYSQLVQGNNVGSSTNLEGYAKYAFNYNNFYGNGNISTTGFFVGSGAKLKNTNYTDLYHAKNLSYYLVSNPKGYINVSIGDGAKNLSYYLASNPKGYINVSIGDGAKNLSYYLASNPKGYINVSIGDGAKNLSYYLASNPKGYINVSVGDGAKNLSYYLASNPKNYLNSTLNMNLTGNTTVHKIILDMSKNKCIVTNSTHIIISNNLSSINCGNI